MVNGAPSPLPAEGARVFSLPASPLGASLARAALTETMSKLVLPQPLIDNGVLAVSELAANSYQHASGSRCELWIWKRITPCPQLVVSIFDADRTRLPVPSSGDLLSERGRGLAIVTELTDDTGTRFTRSRLQPQPALGKAVWFALRLDEVAPPSSPTITPSRAAWDLLMALASRGISTVRIVEANGPTVVSLDGLRVEVTRTHYVWHSADGTPTRYPLSDLQDTVENLIQQTDH